MLALDDELSVLVQIALLLLLSTLVHVALPAKGNEDEVTGGSLLKLLLVVVAVTGIDDEDDAEVQVDGLLT